MVDLKRLVIFSRLVSMIRSTRFLLIVSAFLLASRAVAQQNRPQLTITVRIAEVTEDAALATGVLDFLNSLAIKPLAGVDTFSTGAVIRTRVDGSVAAQNILVRGDSNRPLTTVLTETQSTLLIKALEQRRGCDLLTMPKVTTLSGRQAQLKVVDIKYVLTSITQPLPGSNEKAHGKTEPVELGPVVDVVPEVMSDGFTIHLTVTGTVKEFLGYEGKADTVSSTGPAPKYRLRQTATTAKVWDGQTLLITGGVTPSESMTMDKVPVLGDAPIIGPLFRHSSTRKEHKRLFFLITPTLIDPAGNPIHTPEDLPFTTDKVPVQGRQPL